MYPWTSQDNPINHILWIEINRQPPQPIVNDPRRYAIRSHLPKIIKYYVCSESPWQRPGPQLNAARGATNLVFISDVTNNEGPKLAWIAGQWMMLDYDGRGIGLPAYESKNMTSHCLGKFCCRQVWSTLATEISSSMWWSSIWEKLVNSTSKGFLLCFAFAFVFFFF
jgi:hypothetical protein